MHRRTMLVLGLVLASTAMPQSAHARSNLFGAVFGALTAPVGAILGAGRHLGRPAAYHRRATAPRQATSSRQARTAAVVAAPVAAGAVGVATSTTPAEAAKAPTTTGSAPSNDPGPQETTQSIAQDTTGSPAPIRSARLGTVGPVAWPGAYADVIGFTLWPKQYGARLGLHGIGDLLSTAFAPGASIAARVRQARADEPGQASAAQGTQAVQCGSVDLTADDWPIAEISSTIELNTAQRGALDQLKIAMSDAVASIKSTCRDDANLGPVERLRAMQNALWAVHDAAQLIRVPLAQFYATLTDSQKQTFAAPPQVSARMSRADMARMCDLPASTDAPMRQIEQAIRPSKAQKASLDVVQKKALEMGQLLMASCLTPMPATPAERLDAAADRLTAVIFAASNVNMALSDFTSQLSDEQKSRLNSLVR